MILKTTTKILWLGFSSITSFDCNCKARQWRSDSSRCSEMAILQHTVVTLVIATANSFKKSFTKIARTARTYVRYRQSRNRKPTLSFKADFFYNSPQVLSLTALPRKDVRRVKWFEFLKYARGASRPLGIFRPEIGRRNSKNPAGPRFRCVSRQSLFQFCARPNHSFLKFGQYGPRACFAGYQHTKLIRPTYKID